MREVSNLRYLKSEQYKDSSHLNDRIQLHKRFSTNPYGWFKWVFDQLDLPHKASILEIGSGSGMLWVENLDRLPSGWSVTLVDFSPGMLIDSRGKLKSIQDCLYCVASDAMSLPFPSETFDAVIANHMLYHVPDITLAIDEIRRVLKNNGQLMAATNGKDHLKELSDIMESIPNLQEKRYSPTQNTHAFMLENGKDLLAQRFDQVDCRSYDDSLIVTEAEPLLAYIYSMIPTAEFQMDQTLEAEISTRVRQLIHKQGAVYIRKCTGVLLCNK